MQDPARSRHAAPTHPSQGRDRPRDWLIETPRCCWSTTPRAKNSTNWPSVKAGRIVGYPCRLTLTEKKQLNEPRCSSLLLCCSEQFLSRRQPIGGPFVLDLLYFFAQPKLVEVLIQEEEPIAPFAWCGSSVTDPVQQFASHRLHLRVGIGFLLSQNMPNRDKQLARNGHNRLLFANTSAQALNLGLEVADDVRPPPRRLPPSLHASHYDLPC